MFELTNKRKVNSTSTIYAIRVEPNSRMCLPLCHMVPMPIVCHVLKGDIIKLEADFLNGYRDGDCVFYISATDSRGYFQFVDDEVRAFWSPNWAQANTMFEFQLDTDLSFTSYKNKMFFYIGWQSKIFCLEKLY